MKIIYLYLRRHCYTFDEKIFQQSAFTSKGWNLERWSAVNWTFDNLEKPLNIDEGKDCYYIDNESILKENLNRLRKEKCYFLIYPYDNTLCSWTIRKNIKKFGFKFANIGESLEISLYTSNYPLKLSFKTIFDIESRKCLSVSTSFIFNCVTRKKDNFSKIKLAWENFWGPVFYKSDINFLTTVIYYYAFPNLFEFYSHKNIMIHSLSYDEVSLSLKKDNEILNNKPYVVFVDQYLSGHSDFVKSGFGFPVTNLMDYCNKLCALFDKIERDFSCEVIIAAHPKAEYNGNEFSGRKIINGKTNDLIKNSLFVLIQTSTCFGLITQLKKSFINIYDSNFFENVPIFRNYYIAIKNVFHCKQLDIGNKNEVDDYKSYITNYNEFFEEYNERYVVSRKSTGEDKLFYEVVEEIVKNRIEEY